MKIVIAVNPNEDSGKFWLEQMKSKGIENNVEYDAKVSGDGNIYTVKTKNGIVNIPWVLCKEVEE